MLHRIYPNWVLLMLSQYIRSLLHALVYTEVLEPCVNFLLEAHHKSQESRVAGTNYQRCQDHSESGKEMSLQPAAPHRLKRLPCLYLLRRGLGGGKTQQKRYQQGFFRRVSSFCSILFYSSSAALGIISSLYKSTISCVCIPISLKLNGVHTHILLIFLAVQALGPLMPVWLFLNHFPKVRRYKIRCSQQPARPHPPFLYQDITLSASTHNDNIMTVK